MPEPFRIGAYQLGYLNQPQEFREQNPFPDLLSESPQLYDSGWFIPPEEAGIPVRSQVESYIRLLKSQNPKDPLLGQLESYLLRLGDPGLEAAIAALDQIPTPTPTPMPLAGTVGGSGGRNLKDQLDRMENEGY